MRAEEAIEIIKQNFPKTCRMVNGRYQGGFDDTECDFGKALLMAIEAIKEVQQYREIGTVKECREAREKQRPKKIVYETNAVFSNGFSHYRMGKCPICDNRYNSNDEVNYCSKCGQAIQWENLEDRR